MTDPIANEYQVVRFTRTSILSGITRTLEFPVTEQQLAAYQAGAYVQDAFPHLSKDAREFIKTGIDKEEWEDAFGTEEENV